MRYAKPQSLDEALALLGEGSWRVLAGGTDLYPAQGAGPLRGDVLDIAGLRDLRHITTDGTGITIGARATWTDVLRHDLPPAFLALKQAARDIGSIQIQNVATVAGNLCNASPAADGVPPLLALDAEVELCSISGARRVRLDRFILGNRRTARRADELVTALFVPSAAALGASAFVKLGARRYLVISIAMAAARLVVEDGRVVSAAVAVGACSAAATRLPALEAALAGLPADASLARVVAAQVMDELAPIDDVRATADYRREAAREIVARAVLAASGAPIALGDAA